MSDRSKEGGIDWEASRAVLQACGKLPLPAFASPGVSKHAVESTITLDHARRTPTHPPNENPAAGLSFV